MNSRACNRSSAWLALRSLLWTILLPGVFAGYVPWRLFGLGRTQFDLTSPTQLLGLVCNGVGVALLAACIFEFARSGRGTLSPVDAPGTWSFAASTGTCEIACAPAVIAIAVYRKEDVDLGITRCLVVRQAVAPGIERGELGSEEETDYATTE